MKNLRLSLKRKWFEMTDKEIKTEEYRKITPYWCQRLLIINNEVRGLKWWKEFFEEHDIENNMDKFVRNIEHCFLFGGFFGVRSYDNTILTLGYPKNTDTERIIKFERKAFGLGKGKTEWGAESNKEYFIIKHGKKLTL